MTSSKLSPSPLPTLRGRNGGRPFQTRLVHHRLFDRIGRELAVILLNRGYRVVVTARDKAKVNDIVVSHDKTGLALALDVDKQDEIDAAVKAAEARFGRIDVLVNNAGYGYLAAIEEGDDDDVRAMFDTNFFGLAAMTRAVLPIMRAQKSGAVVNISSIGGFIGFPGSGYYAATNSRSKACPRRCRRKARRTESRSSSSSRARSAPTGPAARSNAEKACRRLYGDGHSPAPGYPGRKRLASRRSGSRMRSDHRHG